MSFGTSACPVHPLIADHFSQLCGAKFRHGHVAMADLPYRSWLSIRLGPEHQFQGALGGIALFLDGDLAAFHSGAAPMSTTTDLVMTIARIMAGTASDENAKAVTASFHPKVHCFIAHHVPADRQRPQVTASKQNHYEVLGVSPEAAQADVDKAWRRIRSENASDRLERMSAKLRQVAHDECLNANLSRDAIYKARGWD